MIDQVLRREEFKKWPPVLVDIGASGGVHPEWKRIRRFSVGIAFDADERELQRAEQQKSDYRTLHVIKAVVSDKKKGSTRFYLTKSPYCSSTLEPDHDALRQWAFAQLFEVERTVELKSVTLREVLDQSRVSGIDWFKTDSQGIDLRLFESLGPQLRKNVLVADFEPGIIDAYRGEDKLYSVLESMHGPDFWMSDLRIEGSQRVDAEHLGPLLPAFHKRYVQRLIRTSPGWGEISYLNTLKNSSLQNVRVYLLSWVFATIKRQHGFALEVAVQGEKKFGDPVFRKLREDSVSRIKTALW
ncbi:MAG TPA: hypothetical protein VI704_05315, partial [Bacteroidota bacterium]|nr:hypothetical protein [Bacteroidota bacterium]